MSDFRLPFGCDSTVEPRVKNLKSLDKVTGLALLLTEIRNLNDDNETQRNAVAVQESKDSHCKHGK